jgi:hypothetical protein
MEETAKETARPAPEAGVSLAINGHFGVTERRARLRAQRESHCGKAVEVWANASRDGVRFVEITCTKKMF